MGDATYGCLASLGMLFAVLAVLTFLGYLIQLLSGAGPVDSYSVASPAEAAWQKEIIDGVKAYNPNYKLTPEDEKLIRAMAKEASKEYGNPGE